MSKRIRFMNGSLPQTGGLGQGGTATKRPEHGRGLTWSDLDRRGFLGYRAWDFTWRSLGHRYGRHFLARIVLRHPMRALRGYAAFRQLTNPPRVEKGALCLFPGSTQDFLRDAAAGEPGAFLLALGFCQKKLATPASPGECPAGRFNHVCQLLDGTPGETSPPCLSCDVRLLAEHALAAGASLYLMTAAEEITRDILAPALEEARFRQTLMLLCPMSVQAVLAPLVVCRLPGFVIGYSDGHCADFAEWLRADGGDKPKQTALSASHMARALQLLDTLAAERGRLERLPPSGWRRQGSVYMPQLCT
jgi:hypothetical protein